MHMADALLSPATGAVMWSATAALTAYSAHKVQIQMDSRKIPLMGVLGAFVFAAQMINFAIPGTGSSGHLGGGLLLAILLGPHAAFLTMASVLTVQALFFADGGLLALGANIFNLGFFPCFVAYPYIYKNIVRDNPDSKRLAAGSLIAALFALQLGSFGVVLQTYLSGVSMLPFSSFLIMMQPIHLAIGLVEGFATVGVVSFIWNARPEILASTEAEKPLAMIPLRNILLVLLFAFVLIGGFLSWFSSEHPDGLEWSIQKVTGSTELDTPAQGVHAKLDNIQQKTAFLPDYALSANAENSDGNTSRIDTRAGTTLSGIAGGLLVLVCGILIGLILKKRGHTV